MKKLLFALIFGFSAFVLHGQDGNDIIYLKDGTIYKGNITEYIPDKQATIKLLDDRIMIVKVDNIKRMSIGSDQIIRKNYELKNKGYFHNSLLGPQWGRGGYGRTHEGFVYNMVNGYRIKNHHMGLGLGMESHLGNWYAPVYADYSYHILKNHISPVVGVNGGFMLPLNNDTGSRYNYTEGSFVGGRIGVVAYSNPHFAFMFNITYRYIQLSGAEYPAFSPWGETYDVRGKAQLHRVGIMLGFVIN